MDGLRLGFRFLMFGPKSRVIMDIWEVLVMGGVFIHPPNAFSHKLLMMDVVFCFVASKLANSKRSFMFMYVDCGHE